MKFTFGIVTGGLNNPNEPHQSIDIISARIHTIISSIERQQIPKNCYEIIVVGGLNTYAGRQNVKHIPFDMALYISRQKNLITQYAKFENIVYQHDYLIYELGWYNNFIQFGSDWDVCMNVINNKMGYHIVSN